MGIYDAPDLSRNNANDYNNGHLWAFMLRLTYPEIMLGHFSVNLCNELPHPSVLFYSFYTKMLSSRPAVIMSRGAAGQLAWTR